MRRTRILLIHLFVWLSIGLTLSLALNFIAFVACQRLAPKWLEPGSWDFAGGPWSNPLDPGSTYHSSGFSRQSGIMLEVDEGYVTSSRGEHLEDWTRVGFPARAFAIADRVSAGSFNPVRGFAAPPREFEWRGRLPGVGNIWLPCRPLWRGIALNAISFAILAAALWLAPRMGIKVLRHWRSQCPACGYSRHGLPDQARCPECGRNPPSTSHGRAVA